jgi:hypothetical protein
MLSLNEMALGRWVKSFAMAHSSLVTRDAAQNEPYALLPLETQGKLESCSLPES